MRWEKVFSLFIIVVLVIGGAFLAVKPIQENLKLGLDLKGGVQVRLQAEGTVTDQEINKIIAIMRNRIDGLGVTEPLIQKEGTNRVLIEIPGIEDAKGAIELIGQTAQLEFRTMDNGEVVLTGKDLKKAEEGKNVEKGEFYVNLEFNKEGAKKFAAATSRLVNTYPQINSTDSERVKRCVGIFLDDEALTVPYVIQAITGGSASIDGFQSLEDAHKTALLINSGALPVPVKIIENRTVGPTLGADSIVKSKAAALWGIVAIMIFMLLFYRVPGIIADLSLVLYSVLLLGVLVLINATLTLPGIAGFLLSIGMCVDANILIYERLKEELRNGKSLRAAMDAGFARAFTTILDSNITTILAAAVLFFMAVGSIKGFAVTLSIGILCSMFTAITFTRFVLKLLIDSGLVKNTKLYGA
jgi:preprotein translocase subunit SecD